MTNATLHTWVKNVHEAASMLQKVVSDIPTDEGKLAPIEAVHMYEFNQRLQDAMNRFSNLTSLMAMKTDENVAAVVDAATGKK